MYTRTYIHDTHVGQIIKRSFPFSYIQLVQSSLFSAPHRHVVSLFSVRFPRVHLTSTHLFRVFGMSRAKCELSRPLNGILAQIQNTLQDTLPRFPTRQTFSAFIRKFPKRRVCLLHHMTMPMHTPTFVLSPPTFQVQVLLLIIFLTLPKFNPLLTTSAGFTPPVLMENMRVLYIQ